jgi:hypothetical protein
MLNCTKQHYDSKNKYPTLSLQLYKYNHKICLATREQFHDTLGCSHLKCTQIFTYHVM